MTSVLIGLNVFNLLCLAPAAFLLLLFGHRVRQAHWLLSVATIAAVTWLVWSALPRLDLARPASPWVVGEFVIALAIVGGLEDWNPPGHLALWALAMSVMTFLAYVVDVTFFSHLGPLSLLFSAIVLMLECAALVLMVANAFEILDVLCRVRWRRRIEPAPTIDYFPLVSIHVPAYNEPPQMVIATLNALARLDYPRFEVVMIDDNTADERLWRPLEQRCSQLGFKFFHLDNWPGFKSGALNFALTQTDPQAEVVAIVDADYIVEPMFLRDLVGLFRDPKVAFVQTPQDYYDVKAGNRFAGACYDAYQYFFRISMASRNEHNGIIFAGTMGLIRRPLLEQAGGWNEWCITEDAEISLRLLARGYHGLFVDRTYGRGLMPLDFAGLRRQRFRWAFGGMQILRLHWRSLLFGRDDEAEANHLTLMQKLCYWNGGLQWLSDPLSLLFTLLLFIGSAALVFADSLFIVPMVPAVVVMPLAFSLFGILRFLWALPIRLRSSLSAAYGALTILFGLTWVVTLACFQGLVRREGVFLRTPKQGNRSAFAASLYVVRAELVIVVFCLLAMVGLVVSTTLGASRFVLVVLLAWQSFLYFSAVRASLWSYAQGGPILSTARDHFGHLMSEGRASRAILVAAALIVILYSVSIVYAPHTERVYSVNSSFPLPGSSLIQQTTETQLDALIYFEEDAALEGNVDGAVALWSEQGMIVDRNFTPDDTSDDRVWQGLPAIRDRYVLEFARRQYLDLEHTNISLVIEGNQATAINDLHAVIKGPAGLQSVQLGKSDRWTFRKEGDVWRIWRLEVNTVPR